VSVPALMHVARSFDRAGPGDAPPEWLVTNGLGGYAFGSVDGVPRRRHHGLLVAALPAPEGRTVLVQAVTEQVRLDDGTAIALEPTVGTGPAMTFALVAGLPVWTFQVTPAISLERSIVMPRAENTVHVRYRLVGEAAALTLELRPWLDVRGHNTPVHPVPGVRYAMAPVADDRVEVMAHTGHVLRLAVTGAGAGFAEAPLDRNDLPLSVERERGYDWMSSGHSPGIARLVVSGDTPVYFSASCDPWDQLTALPPDAAFDAELARRERLILTSHPALQRVDTFLTVLAADQFLIRPVARKDDAVRARAAGAEPRSVIAGYPWFTDWGRDTMISLEGLTLATGRVAEARDILRTFALHVRDGLIPNLFPEGEREGLYHTADATLWFFHALERYDTVSGDRSLVDELLDLLSGIIDRHRAGTRFNIRIDDDGLLTQGAADLPLTWMDARMDGWVVTPRRGKPVEINALWHNALWLLHSWMVRAGRGLLAEDVARAARHCHDSFNARFWNPARGCLFDVVDGDDGDDPSCRPNQLFAVAVRYPPLEPARWAAVLDVVEAELLTPFGLRTLSPSDPAYQPRYYGPLRARDGAYHQGTVWPWLLGPFVDAWLKVHPADVAGARGLLAPLLAHVLQAGCVGSMSEIFDPEPPYTSRGCVAQAWSVAEVARLLARLEPSDASGEAADQPRHRIGG
jgi:predicted glycogen debranching enzyme